MSNDEKLRMLIEFILGRMIADRFNERCPASWRYILLNLEKCGVEVRECLK